MSSRYARGDSVGLSSLIAAGDLQMKNVLSTASATEQDRANQLMLIQRMSCASPIGQNRTSCTFLVNGPNHLVL